LNTRNVSPRFVIIALDMVLVYKILVNFYLYPLYLANVCRLYENLETPFIFKENVV